MDHFLDDSDIIFVGEYEEANKRLVCEGYAATNTPSVSIWAWDRGHSSNIHLVSAFSLCGRRLGMWRLGQVCNNLTKFFSWLTSKRLVGTFCRVDDGPVLFDNRGKVPSFSVQAITCFVTLASRETHRFCAVKDFCCFQSLS